MSQTFSHLSNITPVGSWTISPPVTTTFTLTATDASGQQAISAVTIAVHLPAVIQQFYATSTSGCTAGFLWSASGDEDTTVSLDRSPPAPAGNVFRGSGAAALNVQYQDSPNDNGNYTYVLTVRNGAGRIVTQALPFTVNCAAPVITKFIASRSTISAGESLILNWQTANAVSANIGQVGNVSVNGSQSVSPTASVTYNLLVTSVQGKTVSAVVVVQVFPAVQIVAFSATVGTCTGSLGQADLTWQVVGGTEARVVITRAVPNASLDIFTTVAGAAAFVNSGLANGTYTYIITVTNGAGVSATLPRIVTIAC